MTYPGGKNGAGVYQSIINQMPPHTVYIEPFLGGGAVMRYKRPAAVNIGCDLDAGVIASFKEHGSAIASDATRSHVDSRRPPRPGCIVTRSEEVLHRFLERDAIEFLRDYQWTGGELIYCDPPYMHETRGRTDFYKYEMDDRQHRDLLRVCMQARAMVILSGYHTTLYSEMLAAWRHVTFQTTNRAGALTTEHLWMNYPEPQALHDYRYLGKNFREREGIKRRQSRWLANMDSLPVLERKALLSLLSS